MRALKNIENGTYVDLGAHDPVKNSVSLAFYERGWRGIHVDPSPVAAAALRKARPDEEIIEAACTAGTGKILVSVFGSTGLTTGIEEIARMHEAAGWTAEAVEVDTLSLSEVLHRLDGRDIHWLKIDVEGMEKDVLKSWGSCVIRPWIVVVESTVPFSTVETYAEWEQELLARGYKFAYFDGLNRYYNHESRSELAGAFGPGANYFDDFSITEDSPFAKYLNEKNDDKERRLQEAHDSRARELESQITCLKEAHDSKARELEFQITRLKEAHDGKARRLEAQIARLKEAHDSRARELEFQITRLKETHDSRARELET